MQALETLARDRDDLRKRVQDAQAIIARLDRDLDFFTWELRPPVLDDLGVPIALEHFVQEWSKNFDIPSEYHTRGFEKIRLAREIETSLYRIAQEALNNIYKHANAKRVAVLLERRGDEAVLVIEDDGRGFDRTKTRAASETEIGLIGMDERAALVGATLEIETAPGRGTTVFVAFRTHSAAACARPAAVRRISNPRRGVGYRFFSAFFPPLDRFRDRLADLRGTFAPFLRASLSAMAIACFRLLTLRPEPLFNVPFLRRRIADSTFFDAALPYLAMRSLRQEPLQTTCTNLSRRYGCDAAGEGGRHRRGQRIVAVSQSGQRSYQSYAGHTVSIVEIQIDCRHRTLTRRQRPRRVPRTESIQWRRISCSAAS